MDHVHEEIQLLAIDFSTMLFETDRAGAVVARLLPVARPDVVVPLPRKILQVLQWQRGGERWVLKSPQHLEQFGPLSTVFPDATYVVTHRDPVAVTVSLCTMIAYSSRLSAADPDPQVVGRYWSARIEEMLRACVRDRDVLPADQSIDVRFDEFMADDVAMVERIYALAGQPFDDGARAAMDAFMVEHPRGRHGGGALRRRATRHRPRRAPPGARVLLGALRRHAGPLSSRSGTTRVVGCSGVSDG